MSDDNKSFAELLKNAISEQKYILISPESECYADMICGKDEDNIDDELDESNDIAYSRSNYVLDKFNDLFNEKDDIDDILDELDDIFDDISPPLIELSARVISYKILRSFEIYGEFLNPIPYQKKKDIIDTHLLPWINSYSTNHIRAVTKEYYPIEKEAGKEITKNIGIIEKFETMLLNNFALLQGMELEEEFTGDKYLDISINLEEDNAKRETLKSVQTLLKATEDLKNDLKNKAFKIFPKHKYYYIEAEPKKRLTAILDDLISTYNLKGHSIDKKDLVDSF